MRVRMIDVELAIGLEWDINVFGQTHVEKAVDAAIKVAENSAVADSPVPISVSIKLSDNKEVHALNRQWRKKDKPTNILSFPMLDDDELDALLTPLPFRGGVGGGGGWDSATSSDRPHPNPSPEEEGLICPEIMLGDIILAHGVCAAEAAKKGITLADHATHLVIHGMLHLLGYDHIDNDDAEQMEALEVKALASMGLHNPYDGDI